MRKFSDTEIIEAMLSPDSSNPAPLLHLLNETRKSVEKWLKKQGNSPEHAKEVVAGAMLVLLENLREEKFLGNSSLSTYLLGICKFTWLLMLRRSGIVMESSPNDRGSYSQNHPFLYKELRNKLFGLFKGIKMDCRKTIDLWAHAYTAKEIAQETNLKSPYSASNKVHKCLKKIRTHLLGDPKLYDELKQYLA